MRCDILFFASFLPAVLAQSGFAQPSGGHFGGSQAVTLSNSTRPSGHPMHPTGIPHAANFTAPNSSRWNSSKPTNGTSGYGVCRKKNSTNAVLNATSAIKKPTVLPTRSGRFPITKGDGFHFANSTAEGQRPTKTGTPFLPSGTGTSSGFVHPTGVSKSHNTIVLTSGRAPYTRTMGAAFTNSTAELSGPTEAGSPLATGASSDFVGPSGGNSFTRPAMNATRPASSSGRLPITSSKGLHFGNSTTIASASSFTPTSIFPTGSETLNASGGLPYTISEPAGFANATPTVVLLSSSSASVPLYTTPVSSATTSNTTTVAPSLTIPTSIHTQVTAVDPSSIKRSSSGPSFSLVGTSLTTTSSVLSTTAVPTFSTVTLAPYTNTTSLSLFNPAPTTLSTLTSPSVIVSQTSFTTISESIIVPVSGTSIITAVPNKQTSEVVPEYYQCGGVSWKGGRKCAKGTYCKNQNPYYHQCVRK